MIAHVILGFQKTHHYHKNMQIRKVGGKRGLVVSNSACVGVPDLQSVRAVVASVDRSGIMAARHVTPKHEEK